MGHYADFKYVITDINGLDKYRFTSPSSPPLESPLTIQALRYSVDIRFIANPSDFLSQSLSQSEVRYERSSRYSDGSIRQVKILLVLHSKRPSKLLQVQKQI